MTSTRACGLLIGLTLPLYAVFAGEAKAGDKQLVIGFSVPETMYPLFADMAKAAKAEAEALGVRLDLTDANFSETRQEVDLDGLVKRRVDGIVVCPFYTGSTAWAIDDAADTGIPVAEVLSSPTSSKVLFAVDVDNADAGRMVARLVIGKLHGEGSVLALDGPKGMMSKYWEAFDSELHGSSLKVLGRSSSSLAGGGAGQVPPDPAIAALIREHPRFDAIVSMADALVVRALRDMAVAGIDPASRVIVGYSAVPDTRRAIREGKVTASIDPRPGEQARQALRLLVEYLRTKKLPASKQVLVAPTLVTKDSPEG